jgi:hypothetical protein
MEAMPSRIRPYTTRKITGMHAQARHAVKRLPKPRLKTDNKWEVPGFSPVILNIRY